MLILLLNLIMGMMSATISNPPEELEMPTWKTEYIQVRQLDLSGNKVLRDIIKTVIQQDSTKNTCYYSVIIKNYKNQYIVKVTAHTIDLLSYSEDRNWNYGYSVSSNNIPIIFSIIGNYKLKYKTPKSEKTFERRGKSYPPCPYDPDEWWFFVSGKIYVEVDYWTGISMWTNTLEEYE